jgi:hypothetical protein
VAQGHCPEESKHPHSAKIVTGIPKLSNVTVVADKVVGLPLWSGKEGGFGGEKATPLVSLLKVATLQDGPLGRKND